MLYKLYYAIGKRIKKNENDLTAYIYCIWRL